jgi:DNA-binding GntR family transcriptional regulator
MTVKSVFSAPKRSVLHQTVVEAIMQALESGQLSPGERLVEQDISRQMASAVGPSVRPSDS